MRKKTLDKTCKYGLGTCVDLLRKCVHFNRMIDEKFGTLDVRLRGLEKRKERKECFSRDEEYKGQEGFEMDGEDVKKRGKLDWFRLEDEDEDEDKDEIKGLIWSSRDFMVKGGTWETLLPLQSFGILVFYWKVDIFVEERIDTIVHAPPRSLLLLVPRQGSMGQEHHLQEKKYPLRKKVLLQMLELKLESEEDSTMALELIRFVKKLLAELEPEDSNGDEEDL
ncbi:hypothetical protein Tco_1406954 [Tanacetum coccineum]